MKFIEKDFHKYLYTLVKNEVPENKTAKVIAAFYKELNLTSKEKLFESILSFYNIYSDNQFEKIKFQENNTPQLNLRERDFRLKSFRVEACRRFPKVKDNIKYGIDFEIDGSIKNHIFLGQNGSGKSSIFCGLEYIYTQRIGEKDLRSADLNQNSDNSYTNYLSHFGENAQCIINTVNGQYSINKPLPTTFLDFKKCLPENHFVSDYNLYEKGKIDCSGNNNDEFSFHRLIANSLGLQEYLNFVSLLRALSSYRRSKELIERKKLWDEKDKLNEVIQIRQNEIKEKTTRRIVLEEGIKDDAHAIESQNTLNQIISLKQSTFKIDCDSTKIKAQIDNLESAYINYISLSTLPNLQNEAHFLSLGLELINHSDDCPLCGSSSLRIEVIKDKISKRLESIKEYQEARKALKFNLNNFIDILFNSKESLEFILKKLRNEIDLNKGFSQLASFTDEELNKLNLLTELYSKLVLALAENNLSKTLEDSSHQNVISRIISNKNAFLTIFEQITDTIDNIAKGRQTSLFQIETLLKSQTFAQAPKEEIAILISEIKKAQTAIENDEKRIGELGNDIDKLSKVIETINVIKEETISLTSILEHSVNELTAESFDVIKDTVTDVLEDYLKEDGAYLNLYIKEEVNKEDNSLIDKTIVAEIQKIEDGILKTIPPSIYFNTFRYRLLCLMVCISIVIVIRQQTRVNLPLVMDDIFNSSDYTSKSTFRKFVTKLFNIFKKFNGDMPLQLILFTHDELIFDCALDAIADYELEKEADISANHDYWLSELRNKTVFSRLFSPKDIDDEISKSIYGDYKDITYKIPTLIQDQLINEQ